MINSTEKPIYRPKTKLAVNSHLKFVFQDPDFKAQVEALKPFTHVGHDVTSGWFERESLAIMFGIGRADVVAFEKLVSKGIDPGSYVEDKFYITYLKQHAKFEIYLDTDISREDFENMWKAIQNLRREHRLTISRTRRDRLHSRLTYAIYKGTTNSMRFADIFEQLKGGRYKYYKRGLPQNISTKEALENEFFKHYEHVES